MIYLLSQTARWSLCGCDGYGEESPSIKRTWCQLTAGEGDFKDSATEIDFPTNSYESVE